MDGPARLTCRAGTARAGNSRAGVYLGDSEGTNYGMPLLQEEGTRRLPPAGTSWKRVPPATGTWTVQ